MSAFMHSATHINEILNSAEMRKGGSGFSWYFGGARKYLDRSQMTAIGQMLMHENAESVASLYDMKNLESSADGGTRPMMYLEYLERAASYVFTPRASRRLSPIAAIKAIDSYEYQSCEHEGWETSEARAFVQQLTRYLITLTPEYAQADSWRLSEPATTAVESGMVDLTAIPAI